jgi:hypothetical protein
MDGKTMTCLGECRGEHIFLCAKSGKCVDCCDNECGCGFARVASESEYDNLCERKWLAQQEIN